MSNKCVEEYYQERNRQRYLDKQAAESPPDVNTKEYKKEQLIAALVKELGESHDKPKRIRKVVNKYY